MDNKLSSAPKEALVEIVKLSQKRGMKGDQGDWKEFLTLNDKKFGANMSDPSKRTHEILLKFLHSFKEEEDLNYFNKVLERYSNRELVKQLGHARDSESPEQKLVRLTLEHPMYPTDYSFPSFEEGWVITKLKKPSKLMKSSRLLAIDCEMVLCDDGSEALIKICVVDRNLKVKLHEFVKPKRKVVDYRSEITGVCAEDLKEANHSLEDIQESIKKLLSHTGILVGHGLNNDMNVLKIDHARVIDTAYIFKYGDESSKRKPSLTRLCKSVLGYELRKEGAPHNCFDDACAAMKLVLTKIKKGFDDVVPMACDMVEVQDSEKTKLFLHRIPMGMLSDELREHIPGDFTIEIQTSKKGPGAKYYSAYAIFANHEEAIDAYHKLQEDESPDSYGRPQKTITIKLNSGSTATIYVRKVADNSCSAISAKRPNPAEDEGAEKESKKLKKEKKSENGEENRTRDEQVKEIERLKEELKQRDVEISNLRKIVAALTRKQGL